jgi:hypothetical protein
VTLSGLEVEDDCGCLARIDQGLRLDPQRQGDAADAKHHNQQDSGADALSDDLSLGFRRKR